MALGVKAHEQNGQKISQLIVSCGISKSDLMVEILEKTPGPNSFEIAGICGGSALGEWCLGGGCHLEKIV